MGSGSREDPLLDFADEDNAVDDNLRSQLKATVTNMISSRKLLDKEIPLEEFQKLVTEKKTGLIKGFVSKRTRRPFDANLILKEGGGIGFEFPPRKKKSA